MQIARRPSPVRGSFPSARKALAAMAMALAAHAAQAANPNDWWVYLANDYADDIRTCWRKAPIPMSVSRMASRR